MDIKQNIATNIKKYREANGLSQPQLGTILGFKKTTVSSWERGQAVPDCETLYKMCLMWHISLERMYGVELEDKITDEIIAKEAYRRLLDFAKNNKNDET